MFSLAPWNTTQPRALPLQPRPHLYGTALFSWRIRETVKKNLVFAQPTQQAAFPMMDLRAASSETLVSSDWPGMGSAPFPGSTGSRSQRFHVAGSGATQLHDSGHASGKLNAENRISDLNSRFLGSCGAFSSKFSLPFGRFRDFAAVSGHPSAIGRSVGRSGL